MRLDLFLKTSRLIKRRTVAREMCDTGRVFVNGHEAKPAREITPGDRIILKFAIREIELEVLAMPAPAARKAAPVDPYRVISEKRLSRDKDVWNENLSSS